jgi:hypothetical protein
MKKFLLLSALLISYASVFSQCNLTLTSNSSSSKLLKGTNSITINTKLALEKIMLEKIFDIEFKLKYYSGDVAFASSNCKTSGCDGTIGLGVDLITKLLKENEEAGYWMVLSILSHEAAHIFQYKNKITFKNTVHQEVHADYIAGWYMGKLLGDYEGEYDFSNGGSKAFNEMWDRVQSIKEWKHDLRLFFGVLGDNNYTSIDHHGNFTTRSMAINSGMESYTGWAEPISTIDGKSRDYKKLLATNAKRFALNYIKRYNH